MEVKPTTEFDFATAPKRNSITWKQGKITWGKFLEYVVTPACEKEAGNYIFGEIEGERRNKASVVSRCALTLDIDFPDSGFIDRVQNVFDGYAYALHSTFSSTKEKPRYRLIMPLSEKVGPAKYTELCYGVMALLGNTCFDPTTAQHERYMFLPATNGDGYTVLTREGKAVEIDNALLQGANKFDKSPRESVQKRKDPKTLKGVAGLFCQAYQDWAELIRVFELPYEQVTTNRFHLNGAKSEAGMAPIAENPGFVYSYHANDPAGGRAMNAFDLVRVHKFGDLDAGKDGVPVNRLPSTKAMNELAANDERVKKLQSVEILKSFSEEINDETDSTAWVESLSRNKFGVVENTIQNLDLITAHDPIFKGIVLNVRGMSMELTPGSYPWRDVHENDTQLDDYDFSSIMLHLERTYRLRISENQLRHVLRDLVQERKHDFVQEYLEGLVWDGTPRVEFALPGVEDSPHTRLVARKVLVAAVARTFEPGIKWDNMLMIYGPEGIGKSWWIEKMSRGWYNSLDEIGNKDTLMKMGKSWIVTADEGHSLRAADFNKLKEFLTQRKDEYRAPFAATVTSYPRRSVVWGTTNDPAFLRRQDGNRRFLIVHAEHKVDFDSMTDDYINQVWAEAVQMYKDGEKLHFTAEETELLNRARTPYIQEEPLTGLILQYVDSLVPAGWENMSLDERLEWRANAPGGFAVEGTEPINSISALQVWCEVLNRRIGDHTSRDIAEIQRVLRTLPGWILNPSPRKSAAYGTQQVFVRVVESDLI
nr:MAG TPA: virulence associated protein E [Caudoviricetes sp.]